MYLLAYNPIMNDANSASGVGDATDAALEPTADAERSTEPTPLSTPRRGLQIRNTSRARSRSAGRRQRAVLATASPRRRTSMQNPEVEGVWGNLEEEETEETGRQSGAVEQDMAPMFPDRPSAEDRAREQAKTSKAELRKCEVVVRSNKKEREAMEARIAEKEARLANPGAVAPDHLQAATQEVEDRVRSALDSARAGLKFAQAAHFQMQAATEALSLLQSPPPLDRDGREREEQALAACRDCLVTMRVDEERATAELRFAKDDYARRRAAAGSGGDGRRASAGGTGTAVLAGARDERRATLPAGLLGGRGERR